MPFLPLARYPHEGLSPQRILPGYYALDRTQSHEEALAVVLFAQAVLLWDDGEALWREAEYKTSVVLHHSILVPKN